MSRMNRKVEEAETKVKSQETMGEEAGTEKRIHTAVSGRGQISNPTSHHDSVLRDALSDLLQLVFSVVQASGPSLLLHGSS